MQKNERRREEGEGQTIGRHWQAVEAGLVFIGVRTALQIDRFEILFQEVAMIACRGSEWENKRKEKKVGLGNAKKKNPEEGQKKKRAESSVSSYPCASPLLTPCRALRCALARHCCCKQRNKVSQEGEGRERKDERLGVTAL